MSNEQSSPHEQIDWERRAMFSIFSFLNPFRRGPGNFAVPFELFVVGAMSEGRMDVPETDYYYFFIDIGFTPDQRSKIEPLMGSAGSDRQGRRIVDGLPIPVQLCIRRNDVSPLAETILDGRFDHLPLTGRVTNAFIKTVHSLRLEPGIYTATLRNLRSNVEVAGATTVFYAGIRFK